MTTLAPARLRALRRALLRWYDAHARDLPWRRTRDPYAIWVSEVMCQQTRVETAVPYFRRFMARFPTLADLARAEEGEVLALWSGLGYYRRARMLHAGVREVVARHGGAVPAGRAARRALPGVGPYTAGAIGSIAFGREEPAVDGNVARVLCRLALIDTPLGRADTERALWELAGRLVVGERPGALNQAVMELGARVCAPRRPACDACPARRRCGARARGAPESLPTPRPRRPPTPTPLVAVVARHRRDLFLVRSRDELYRGLWGVPVLAGSGRPRALAALRAAELSARLEPEPRGEVEHLLSHRRLEVTVWRARAARPLGPGPRRVPSGALDRLGVSRLTRKILEVASRRRPAGALRT